MKKLLLFLCILTGINGFGQISVRTQTTPTQLTAGNGTVVVRSGSVTISGTPTVSIANTATNVNITATVTTGNVGGFTQISSNTITTSASPDYSSGDNVGGIITMTLASRTSGGTGIISDLIIWDKDAQSPDLVIDYFDTSPSGTYTDNSAQVIAGDHGVWLGRIKVYAADWEVTGAVGTVSIPVGIAYKTVGTTSLYFTIKTKSTINASSTSEFVVKHKLLQD